MFIHCNAQDRLFCIKNKRKMSNTQFAASMFKESTLFIKCRTSAMITVAIVVLAAGKATRMGQSHKLLAQFDGVALIRRMVTTSLGARGSSVTVVTGHRRSDMEACLHGLPIRLCFNADYNDGMASSIVAALRQPDVREADGMLVLLADMPQMTADHLDRLIAAFEQAGAGVIVRATANGESGNPVILPRALYSSVLALKGDRGAKALIEASGLSVVDVEIGAAAILDVDTVAQVLAAGGVLD
jgi:molybdenum cofactor cytidylyltransferase